MATLTICMVSVVRSLHFGKQGPAGWSPQRLVIRMDLRFYFDPETGEPHIHRHSISEAEVQEVMARPVEDRAGTEGSRVALGRTAGGAIFG